jgi:hypothetical protein
MLFSAAQNNVIIVVGPSMLTHAWQPNDSGTNKTFKDNIKKALDLHLEMDLNVSASDVALVIVQALKAPNMPQAIINSFSHTGIWPLEPLKMVPLIEAEKPDPSVSKDSLVQKAVEYTKEHLKTLDHLCAQKQQRDATEKKKRRVTISTEYAAVLTSPEALSTIIHSKEISEMVTLNVGPLRERMKSKLGFTQDHLLKPGSAQYKTKKELVEMVKELYNHHLEATAAKVAQSINEFVFPAPLPALCAPNVIAVDEASDLV